MVNLFFLKTFIDTVKTGSVKSAAHKNYVTQPAVTQHIRLLEEKLDCKLFERKGRKNQLTACGRILYKNAGHILKQYENTKVELLRTHRSGSAVRSKSCR